MNLMEEKPINLDRKEPIPGEYGHPIPRELLLRELGYTGQYGRHNVGKRIVSQTLSTKAVYTMSTQEEFKKRSFKLPTGARTTFHMAFSADGTKVASCHGDHNVYVCDVASGKVVQTLTGHPRTPWCVVFHPTQNDVLASGCLAGQVRVWDLKGGSETLVTDSGTVIASLAFHPLVRLLAIATFNEIIFWDWGLPYPLARCSTENTKEKVRLVRFDRLGRNLITGITNYPNPPFRESCKVQGSAFFRPSVASQRASRAARRAAQLRDEDLLPVDTEDDDEPNEGHEPSQDQNLAMSVAIAAAAGGQAPNVADALNDRQERFQESYRQLVNHYQDLVNHYQQFLRSRIPRLIETSRVVREQPHMQATNFIPVVAVETLSDSSPEVSNDASDASTPVNVNPDGEEPAGPLSPDEPEPEYSTTASPEQLPEAIVIDQETPGPSRLMQLENTLLEHMETEAAATLANLPNLMSNSASNPPTPGTSQNANNPGTSLPRRGTDLQSIEELAQNILEMQNLCTQARRDAPLTVETQHIIELQNIRHHLELLQEQTRDLQSSIRATLSSLAHGSFDALRSHIVSNVAAAAAATPPTVQQVPHPTPADLSGITMQNINVAPVTIAPNPHASAEHQGDGDAGHGHNDPPVDIEMHVQTTGAHPHQQPLSPSSHEAMQIQQNYNNSTGPAVSANNHNPVIRITISPHITTANNPVELGRLSPPGPYVYSNSPPPSRSRVPPIVTMQYDFGDGIYRARTTTTSALNQGINMDPVPGPSHGRDIPQQQQQHGTSTTYQVARSTVDPVTGNRRVVREFHVMGRPTPGESEHSRGCPYSTRDGNLSRPPPRMRCLTEMGETPQLSVWPTTETGQEQATRSFQGANRPIEGEEENRRNVNPSRSSNSTPGQGERGMSFSNPNGTPREDSNANPFMAMHPLYNSTHLPSFSHWMNSGPYWVNSDVGVGVYLSVRQLNESAHLDAEQQQQLGSEDWQRFFVSGLALVPPAVRQGQRHHSRRQRRTPNIIYHMGNGSSRAVPLRPSAWDEFRSNLYTSSSPTELGSLSPNSPYLAGISTATDVPAHLDGNFNRIYSMRMGDEIIPVYSHWPGPPDPLPGVPPPPLELRDSPQNNVYTFPIGLFLVGSFWTNGASAVGIFWPPNSREEEDLVIEFRRTEATIPIMTQTEMEIRSLENRSTIPFRIDYSPSSLVIHVSPEISLTMIQPGLTLLDAVTTMVNWQRPRATSGTVYVNYLGPLFDAFERLFGHRMRRSFLPTNCGITGAGPLPHGTASRIRSSLNSTTFSSSPLVRGVLPRPGGGSDLHTPTPPETGAGDRDGSAAAAAAGEGGSSSTGSSRRGSRGNHPRRYISFADGPPYYHPTNIISRYPGETLEAYRRRLYHDYLGQDVPEGSGLTAGGIAPHPLASEPQSLTHFISVSRNRLGRMTRSVTEQRNGADYQNQELQEAAAAAAAAGDGQNSNSTRRFIRLAVDTATAEVLRRHQANSHGGGIHGGIANPSVQSAIESRIERVLNERGNRGMAPLSPTNFPPDQSNSNGTQQHGSSSRQHRPEELQMRINVLTQWSRHRAAMSNSGTQTPRSFLRTTTAGNEEGTGIPGSQSQGQSTSTGPTNILSTGRLPNRRRPHSRMSRTGTGGETTNSDDEGTPPLPPRIPRMTLLPRDPVADATPPVPTSAPVAAAIEDIAMGSQDQPQSGQGQGQGQGAAPPAPGQSTPPNFTYMPFGEHWVIRRQRLLNSERPYPYPGGAPGVPVSFAARRIDHQSVPAVIGPSTHSGPNYIESFVPVDPATTYNLLQESSARTRAAPIPGPGPGAANANHPNPLMMEDANRPSTSNTNPNPPNPAIARQIPPFHHHLRRNLLHIAQTNAAEEVPSPQMDSSARFYPGYIPEILITPRARPPTYYTMDAATTAFLSSRIQKWDFSQFVLPDITKRDESVVVRECSLHSDACLDVSSDSDFLAVLQPSDNGQYSAVGLYSLQDESLGGILYIYHFDQNTVSVSISPSCDYIVVGYAGRGPFYRFVHPSRNIGQILSLTRDGEKMKLVSVKELFADSQSSLMSINCMHWVPVPGYGIIYGTNTGELVLLS